MTEAFMLAAVLLLASMAAALVRAWRGPTSVDRIMAVQLVGTGMVGVAIALGAARNEAAMLDAALVATLLAAVAVSAFVRRPEGPAAPHAASDPRALDR